MSYKERSQMLTHDALGWGAAKRVTRLQARLNEQALDTIIFILHGSVGEGKKHLKSLRPADRLKWRDS